LYVLIAIFAVLFCARRFLLLAGLLVLPVA
jgi:hypothetical protein